MPDVWWCDSGNPREPGGACEIGDEQMCSGLDQAPGTAVYANGALLHKNQETARNPLYPLRGDDDFGQQRFGHESLDAFGEENDWFSLDHRLLFHRYAAQYDLWPCKWHTIGDCRTSNEEIDINECNSFGEDTCHLPDTDEDHCWHLNCGAFVHSGNGIYQKCHLLGNFAERICLKRRTVIIFDPYTRLNRHMIGAQIPHTCMPFLDWQCWGKRIEEGGGQGEYANAQFWEEWNHCKLNWGGRPGFTLAASDKTAALRNDALALLARTPVSFCADQIHRTTTVVTDGPCPRPHRNYSRGEADQWDSFYNAALDFPRDELLVIKSIPNVRLRVSDIPVRVEMVVTSVAITMSFRILILHPTIGRRHVPHVVFGPSGAERDSLRPYVQFKINMSMRPRVTIDAEHEVEVLSDVYADDEPVFSNGDQLAYPDGWRPPLQLEWWGNVGPFSRPRFEPFESPRGSISEKCEAVRRLVAPMTIGGMRTDWTDPRGERAGGAEVYRGSVRITQFGGD